MISKIWELRYGCNPGRRPWPQTKCWRLAGGGFSKFPCHKLKTVSDADRGSSKGRLPDFPPLGRVKTQTCFRKAEFPAQHAFEGKVFNVVASCALDERAIDEVAQSDDEVRRILAAAPPATSMILGPQGELLAEPQVGGEGMVVAEIDLSLSIEQKQFHDIVGYYNRFDIFRLAVDQRANRPATLIRDESEGQTALSNEGRPVREPPLASSVSAIQP